jgi:hypothetical protein
VQSLAEQYKGQVEVKIYKVGKDFEYIKKYGPTTKSMLIINEARVITKLSKEAIRNAFQEALKN